MKIDVEVKRILTEAHETASRVLGERRRTLDRISERLLEKEVIEAEELKSLIERDANDALGEAPPAA